MLTRVYCSVALLSFLTIADPSAAAAQPRDRPSARPAQRDLAPARTTAPSDASIVAEGWTALASGRVEVAARAADRILARRRWDHAAILLKVTALSAADPLRGLMAYEGWLGARSTKDDIGLLEPVARELLVQLAKSGNRDLRDDARRLLARAGIRLPAAPAGSVEGPSYDEEAARAQEGNAASLHRLERAAADPTVPDKTDVALALQQLGTSGVPGLLTLLQASAGPNRAAAAAALGRIKAPEAIPVLRESLRDPDPYVRNSAAVALARLGEQDGQAYVQRMLDSDVPDLRLMAAEAWDGQNGPWVAAIAPLLQNRDGVTRLRAARLLAPVDPEAAGRTLHDAAIDENPAVRAEALKEIAAASRAQALVADLAQLRRALRDPDAYIRLQAAGAVLAAASAGH